MMLRIINAGITKYGVTAARGFNATGAACGLKQTGALDLALVSDTDCTCAGCSRRIACKPRLSMFVQETLAKNYGAIRAVIANSGCANACTGDAGMANAHECRATPQAIGYSRGSSLVLSTGVIGQRLPMAKIRAGHFVRRSTPQVRRRRSCIARDHDDRTNPRCFRFRFKVGHWWYVRRRGDDSSQYGDDARGHHDRCKISPACLIKRCARRST